MYEKDIKMVYETEKRKLWCECELYYDDDDLEWKNICVQLIISAVVLAINYYCC